MHDIAHGHGLREDLEILARLQQRRAALRWLGAGAAALLAGCGGGGASSGAADSTAGVSAASMDASASSAMAAAITSNTCAVIPSETSGRYPGDGTSSGGNGGIANALTQSGIVRSDIVASFGTSSGSADGVALTIALKLVNTNASCASLAGRAIYLWHCDALGRYSMYAQAIAGQNYLRGVQVTDDEGLVTFHSIAPACYDGRWPHIHFEVFASLEQAVSGNNDIKTSQIALPAGMAQAVYADARYTGSSSNLEKTSPVTDNVFSDGVSLQTPTVSGSNAQGYVLSLQVGVQG
ncbi:intradiol ring-cleavage dioxygenase [Ramlibacter sp.]|uniref:dioxygenase family protein n=1 Tax=Ramlibacter sp. TaxID=1917967 RepID=UPI0026318C68|nr:intradiol ring-cleavage dioxygenase [Ramlibacter sp.]MDB5954679.1 intradiol ring-cleavage dioxygenase [Ramlibacter sp.]